MRFISLSSSKQTPTLKLSSLNINNGDATSNSKTTQPSSLKWPQKPIIGAAIVGALSFSLLLSSSPPPHSIALDSSPSSPLSPSVENCREDGIEFDRQSSNLVTDQGIVEEAWEIVGDSYYDTGRNWSPDSWLRKKEDILSNPIKTRSKAHNVIRRMLASLQDPYTRFLSPEEFSKMARYDITGIGINVREIPDTSGSFKLKVLGLILDGAAHTAGVRQGDEILSVDGEDVTGKSAFEVSSMLQGPSETFVTVEVKHGNCGPIRSIKVQRQLVARTPVFYRLEQIDNGSISVGYVRLKEFNALARKDIVTALKRLQDLGASCFVLDLRDNFGGLVQAGFEIAKLFLNKGDTNGNLDIWAINLHNRSPRSMTSFKGMARALNSPHIHLLVLLIKNEVTYTAGRDQSQNAIVAENAPLFSSPVVVLVNHNTASASEIVASALHDNCKAVLVGEKTYGKGLIQSVFELHDGSGVVVTIGKYVTPGHLDINGNGIEPDFRNIPRWSEVTKQLSTCNRLRQG